MKAEGVEASAFYLQCDTDTEKDIKAGNKISRMTRIVPSMCNPPLLAYVLPASMMQSDKSSLPHPSPRHVLQNAPKPFQRVRPFSITGMVDRAPAGRRA